VVRDAEHTGKMPVLLMPPASLKVVRAARVWAVVVVAALGVIACGRRSIPKPPELVAPQAITDLRAENQRDGVMLVWGRPAKHVDGAVLLELGGFIVERAPGDGSVGFQLLTTIELNDRERFRQAKSFRYLDSEPQVGRSYLYRVVAATDDGYKSEPSNAVALTREIPPAAMPTPHARGNSAPVPAR
jgi:hypothetical protein